MALTPATTEFPTVEEGQTFSQTVSYFDETVTEPVEGEEGSGGTTQTPAEIISVVSSIDDSSINIEINENSVTISGAYNNAFPGKTFRYIPKGQFGTYITAPFNEIPAQIDALVGYNPVSTLSTTVIYTVSTESGSATITQTVTNNWDSGKSQMLNTLSRGAY